MSFELYRQTMLGDCLCEALEELVVQEKLTQELAMSVLKQFDAVRPCLPACLPAVDTVGPGKPRLAGSPAGSVHTLRLSPGMALRQCCLQASGPQCQVAV